MPRNKNVRPLKQPLMDDHVQAVIDAVGGQYNEQGHYGTGRYTGCETEARAKEIVQGLHRAAQRKRYSLFTNSPGVYKPWPATEKDGTWTVEFTVVNKEHARKWQVTERGSDRSKWHYSPIKGDPNYDI